MTRAVVNLERVRGCPEKFPLGSFGRCFNPKVWNTRKEILVFFVTSSASRALLSPPWTRVTFSAHLGVCRLQCPRVTNSLQASHFVFKILSLRREDVGGGDPPYEKSTPLLLIEFHPPLIIWETVFVFVQKLLTKEWNVDIWILKN